MIGLIALSILAAGTAVSTVGGLQAADRQKKVEQAQSKAASIRAARERMQQVREARIKQAQIIQAGANVGASESSSVQSGAAGAMQSAFGNIQFINQQESAGKAISTARQGVIDAQGTQTLGRGIADMGGTIFNANQAGVFDKQGDA